ncbi:hypothetical protein ACHAWF_013372 [Thalassiosira exigua]
MIKLKGGKHYPLGLQLQITIDKNGKKIPKKLVTHDLSNQRRQDLSMNHWIDEDLLPETKYGFALLRFLHLLHHLCHRHPNRRILMCKSAIQKAYRRLHVTPDIADKCMTALCLATSNTKRKM